MESIFINKTESFVLSAELADEVVCFTSKYLDQKELHQTFLDKEVTIVVVNKEEGQQMNEQFRGKAYPTDVLSFEGGGECLGDIVLCLPVLESQAEQNNHNIHREFAYLVIHGLLHLLGYEHEQGGEAEKEMFELQDDIFEGFCLKKETN